MLCIYSANKDTYFNLAAEEYFLKNSGEEFFIIWQSSCAVVVGKHQNTLAEINYKYAVDNDINVARRLTGGGTVYHDEGNINFTFIRRGEPGKLVDFPAFIDPVIGFLRTLNIEASQGPKHEIIVNGLKVSGNAEHVYKERILHHGTLLYNTNLKVLQQVIDHKGGNFTDKSVQSNRSHVLNLAECLKTGISLENIKDLFFNYITDNHGGRNYSLTLSESNAINDLAMSKYRQWTWIYGWSPDYSFENSYLPLEMKIRFATHRGIITESHVESFSVSREILKRFNNELTGSAHEVSSIRRAVESSGFREIEGIQPEEFILSFF